MQAGGMGALLGDVHPSFAQVRRTVGVADHGSLVQGLVEGAGDQISPEPFVQMVAVAGDVFAVESVARVLDRRAGRDDFQTVPFRHGLDGMAERFIHLLLRIVEAGETLVGRILRIRPGLVDHLLAVAGRTRLGIPSQVGQPGLERLRPAGLSALLVENHDIPRLIGKRRGEADFVTLDPHPVQSDFAVSIGCGVPFGIVPVFLQRTAADIHVADDQDMPVRGSDLMQVLLDGIFGETVADAEQAQGIGSVHAGRGGGKCHAQQHGA